LAIQAEDGMSGSTLAAILLLYAVAMAVPVCAQFACDSQGTEAARHVRPDRCLLGSCLFGPGTTCRKAL